MKIELDDDEKKWLKSWLRFVDKNGAQEANYTPDEFEEDRAFHDFFDILYDLVGGDKIIYLDSEKYNEYEYK